jgi:hypothetical protein
MRWTLLALTILAGLLAGCSDAPSQEPAGDDGPADSTPSPWDGGDRIALYETHPDPRPAAIQLCADYAQPAPTAFQRNGALVPNGTGSIAVAVTNDDPAVGFQVGSRIDGGPIAWLDPVVDGQAGFSIPVDPSQAEDNATGQRWEFLYRYTVADMGQDCYTGPVLASHPMLIEAVRAEPSGQAPMG